MQLGINSCLLNYQRLQMEYLIEITTNGLRLNGRSNVFFNDTAWHSLHFSSLDVAKISFQKESTLFHSSASSLPITKSYVFIHSFAVSKSIENVFFRLQSAPVNIRRWCRMCQENGANLAPYLLKILSFI